MKSENKWYVRSVDGKVFGPIDVEALKGWVRDGRVEPFAGLSNDLTNWTPAPRMKELEMDWIVENEPGQFYGPTHKAVADDLMKSGTLAPGARIFCDDHGAGKAQADALVRKMKDKDAAIEEANARLLSRDAALRNSDAKISSLKAELAESEKAAKAGKDGMAKLEKELAKCHERLAEQEADLRERGTQLNEKDTELNATDTLLAEKDAALEERSAKLAKCEAALRERESQLAERNARIAAMEKTLREGNDKLSAHEAEASALSEQIAKMHEELAEKDKALAEKDKEIEKLNAEKPREWTAVETVVPEVVVSNEPPPVVTRQAFGKAAALAELERQAQRELAQMGASGARRFFKFGK